MTGHHKVILFDGVCNLCNATVQRVIRNDKKDLFRFSALQSEYGSKFLKLHNLDDKGFKTIILEEGDRYFTKSTAALKIGKELGGIYKVSGILLWIPKFIRDAVYNIISRNRYRWFGKRESCMVPTPELKKKFLD